MGDGYSSRNYYRLKRQRFACIAYGTTAAFLILALGQWYLFHSLKSTKDYFTKNYWVGILIFVAALIFILLFIFLERIRFIPPANWLVGILIYECFVVGVVPLVVLHYKYQVLFEFGVWCLVFILFLIIGSYIPHDLTLDIVVIVVLGIVCTIGAIYFLMLHIVANVGYSFFFYRGLMVIAVLSFVMYHAQIINGGHFAEMRDNDYILAALILVADFFVLFIFTFQFSPKWSDRCDCHKNDYNFFLIDKYKQNP